MAKKSRSEKSSGSLYLLFTASTVVFTCMLLFGLGMLAMDFMRSRQDQAAFRELAELVETQQAAVRDTSPDVREEPEEQEQSQSGEQEQNPYQVLHELNPDFAGWLTVPGTLIDYPVVHTPEDTDYYIHRDFSGYDSPSGTPFVGDYGDLDSRKCIIYGHNMRDGTMFHDLEKYADESFWQENSAFSIQTLDGESTYEIFAAVSTRVLEQNESGLRYYRLEEGLEQWLLDNSLYDTGIVPGEEDSIVILSTCSYHTNEGRFIIAGRMK